MSAERTRLVARAREGVVAVVYLALALLLTWPAVLRPASVLIGHPRGDHWPNLWGYGWVRGELLAGRFPLTIEQLGFPEGGTLYYLDMAIPVEPWLGPVATYNLLVWFNLVLGAVGAFALVRHLTGSRGGAFLAGLVYGFSPYVLGVIASGISECLTVGWLPLFLLAMIRLGETGRWRHGVAAAALAVACLLSSAYHGLTAGVMGGLVVAHGFLLRRPRWPLARLAPLATVLVAAGGLALVQAHFLQRSVDPVTSLDEAAPPMAFLGEDPDWRVRSMVADPVNLVLPGKPPLDSRSPYNVVNHVTYLGWLVLAAAVLGALEHDAGEVLFQGFVDFFEDQPPVFVSCARLSHRSPRSCTGDLWHTVSFAPTPAAVLSLGAPCSPAHPARDIRHVARNTQTVSRPATLAIAYWSPECSD